MLIRLIAIIIMINFTTLSLADQADDKAEFKKLYAEFNDLYANSEAIDPIIAVGEKVYELAPKAYGKNSMNTAVVTYNLASLYLEKAENRRYSELYSKASQLFSDYFRILDKNEAPTDKAYIFQYMQYVRAMASDDKSKSISFHTKKLRKLAVANNYTDAQRAEMEFSLGLNHFRNNDGLDALKYFKKANEFYEKTYGRDHFKTGESAFWVAKIEMARKKRETAEEYFLSALNAFEKNGKLGSDHRKLDVYRQQRPRRRRRHLFSPQKPERD